MKKYLYILFTFAAPFLVSCSDEIPNKADYDFTPNPAALPTVGITLGKVGAYDAAFTGSVTLGSDTFVLQRGFVVSTTADFAQEKVVEADAQAFQTTINGLESGKTYYAKAYVATYNGVAYSNATSFNTKVVTPLFDIQTATSTVAEWMNFGNAISVIDKDGDGRSWNLTYYDAGGTQAVLISYSWYNNSVLTPENYLLLPPYTINSNGLFIVTIEAADPDYPEEKVKLIISGAPITSDNCRAAEVLATHTLANGNPYTINADIPEKYDGEAVYLGIAHYDCTDQYALLLTGIKVVHEE
ncbi:MAG: hypothetical protein LBD87_03020 [Prevotellaceae bacterium]|jgi:hypothetical protein|nr:hypothetical protein [Prevotellaceae bacterium]